MKNTHNYIFGLLVLALVVGFGSSTMAQAHEGHMESMQGHSDSAESVEVDQSENETGLIMDTHMGENHDESHDDSHAQDHSGHNSVEHMLHYIIYGGGFVAAGYMFVRERNTQKQTIKEK